MALLTNVGLEYKAKILIGESASEFKWVALGTDATAEANTQTALLAEITTNGGSRMIADTIAYEADYKAKLIATWSFTGTLGINECGVLDQLAVGGNMLMRHKFAATKNVENGDTLQLTIKETESRA